MYELENGDFLNLIIPTLTPFLINNKCFTNEGTSSDFNNLGTTKKKFKQNILIIYFIFETN